ncbi:MAG: hydrolase TatD, partial [Planctomycetes bacterium]|nr:hydrolase TatD [Planctomycetota bacterium]
HSPHRDKKRGFARCIAILQDMAYPMERVLLDHGNEETIQITREVGCYQGFSIYPFTKMDENRMVAIVQEFGVERMVINSAADWGVSDPLMVPKTIVKLRQAGVAEHAIQQLVWDNPVGFFAQTGRLDAAELSQPPGFDRRETFDGNSVLRGQDPTR